MMDDIYQGGCLCGSIRYEGRGKPSGVTLCHCRQCQRWSGGPYTSVDFSEGVTFTKGAIKWYSSSPYAERGSCPQCGSALFWKFQNEDRTTVSAGSLDDPEIAKQVERHIFIDEQPSWLCYADNAERLTEAEAIAAHEARDSQ